MMKKRNLQWRHNYVGYLLICPALFLVIIFFLYPLISTFFYSFHKWAILGPKPWVGLKNYQRVINDPIWWQALRNTTFYTLLVTPLIFIFAFAFALLVDRKVRGISVFRTIYFMPAVISFVAATLMWKWMYNLNFGLFNYLLLKIGIISSPIGWLSTGLMAIFSLVIMVTWKTAGFSMVILLAGLQSIPTELYEAAKIDGGNFWQVLRWITLPLLRPYFALALILSLIGSFLAFDHFYVMTGGGPAHATETLITWLYRVGFSYFKLGRAAAMAFFVLVILFVLSYVQLRLLKPMAKF